MTENKQLTLAFLRRGDEILLAMKKRGFGAGKWNGTGGKVEPGETVLEATIRETQEEVGVTATQLTKVAIHVFNLPGEEYLLDTHVYLIDEWEGEPTETQEMAPQWFKLSEIPYDKMWDDDKYWLPAVLLGQKLRTTFIFDDSDKLLTANIEVVDSLE